MTRLLRVASCELRVARRGFRGLKGGNGATSGSAVTLSPQGEHASCELRVARILTVVLAMTFFVNQLSYADDPLSNGATASSTPHSSLLTPNSQTSPDYGMGTELSPDTFELYYNGKNLYLEMNSPTRVDPVKTPRDGKLLFVLRQSPFQRAKMDSFQFLYPFPSRAFDDNSGSSRVVRVYTEKGYAITVTDFGGPIDSPESAQKALGILTDSIKQQLSGKLEKPELVTISFSPKLDNASVLGVRTQLRIRYETPTKDKDGKDAIELHHEIYETVGMTVSGEDFFATVVIQMFNRPFSRDVQDEVLTMLKSFESNNN